MSRQITLTKEDALQLEGFEEGEQVVFAVTGVIMKKNKDSVVVEISETEVSIVKHFKDAAKRSVISVRQRMEPYIG